MLAACGEQRTPVNPRGVWRYGAAETDARPASGATMGTVSAAGPETPAPVAPGVAAAPKAPAPSAVPAPPPPRATDYKVVPVKDGGSVRALCRLTAAATLAPLSIFKDNDKGCGAKEHPSERAVFDAATLGLGGCVVSLRRIEAGKDWPEASKPDDRTFVLDQHGCVYVPHVGVVRTGTQMVVVNSDRADHNIHGFRLTLADTMFNFASEPGTRKDVQEAFIERPGAYPMKCDIHPWMSAYVIAVGHPYVDLTSAQADADEEARRGRPRRRAARATTRSSAGTRG